VDVTTTKALIKWTSNENTYSFVEYGSSTAYEEGVIGPYELVMEHQVLLHFLKPGANYHFRIIGRDKSGNLGYSNDYQFSTPEVEIPEIINLPTSTMPTSTLVTASTVPQLIPQKEKSILAKTAETIKKLVSPYSLSYLSEALEASARRVVSPPMIGGNYPQVEIGPDWAEITWLTDKKSNSLVAYAKEAEYKEGAKEPYGIVAGNPDEMVREHKVRLENLQPSTIYHFQVRSKAKIGDWARSEDKTFQTLSEKPELSSLHFISIGDTKATLSWETNLPTKTKIILENLNTGQKKEIKDESFLTHHQYTLKDLSVSTDYNVQLESEDEKGHQALSSILPFSTTLSKNPPIISRVRVTASLIPGRIERVQTIITWQTDKPATSRVYFGEGVFKERMLPQKTSLDRRLLADHIVITTAMKPGRVYQFQIESKDGFGNTSLSKYFTLLTPQPKQSVVDLILKNFEETFGFLKRLRL